MHAEVPQSLPMNAAAPSLYSTLPYNHYYLSHLLVQVRSYDYVSIAYVSHNLLQVSEVCTKSELSVTSEFKYLFASF